MKWAEMLIFRRWAPRLGRAINRYEVNTYKMIGDHMGLENARTFGVIRAKMFVERALLVYAARHP